MQNQGPEGHWNRRPLETLPRTVPMESSEAWRPRLAVNFPTSEQKPTVHPDPAPSRLLLTGRTKSSLSRSRLLRENVLPDLMLGVPLILGQSRTLRILEGEACTTSPCQLHALSTASYTLPGATVQLPRSPSSRTRQFTAQACTGLQFPGDRVPRTSTFLSTPHDSLQRRREGPHRALRTVMCIK